MRRYRKSANPFYVLLVIVGISFALTAAAYGVMMFREAAPPKSAAAAAAQSEPHALLEWMNRYGDAALVVELAALAICTFGAIGTDTYWQRQAEDRTSTSANNSSRR